MEYLQWWNLVFELPLVAAVLYLVLLASGMVAHGDHDMDHDVSMDADSDMDHSLGMEHAVESDHDAGHEGQGDNNNPMVRALSVLGFGRVPLSVLLMSFSFIWGFSGWASNKLLGSIMRVPELYFWLSLVIAFVVSVAGTRGVASMLSKIMPSTETYATTPPQLIGKRAKVRYAIGSDFGRAMITDAHGTLLEISCRTQPGEPAIPEGARVVLMGYDAKQQVYLVRHDPLEEHGLLEQPNAKQLGGS